MDISIQGRATEAARQEMLTGRVSRLSQGQGESEPAMVAREIESLFATLLASEMRKGLGEGFFGSGPGADTFNGWFDEELGSSIASRGSLGLAESVHESLIRQNEAAAAEKARHLLEGRVTADSTNTQGKS